MKQSGFFDLEEMQDQTRVDFRATSDGPKCLECGLYRTCFSPKMEVTGEGKLKTLILLEASGGTEDELGEQLKGEIGQWFRKKLRMRGYNLDKDFWKVNAISCWPWEEGKTPGTKKNRTPTDNEIACCRPKVFDTIEKLKPEYIFVFGGVALKSLYAEEMEGKHLNITKWRGFRIPDKRFNAWVMPLFHPSYPSRDENNKNLLSVFERDLDYALDFVRKGDKIPELPEEDIRILYKFDEVIDILNHILWYKSEIVFDYETTGIKPYIPGHKIATISVACTGTNGEKTAWSFPYQYAGHFTQDEQNQIKDLWCQILEAKNISKIAQNIKFEHIWSKMILDVEVQEWEWDTMLASHIIDNRSGITSLDFQIMLNFGLFPYNQIVNPYLKAKSGEAFNTIMDCPLDSLLKYGGKDSLYELWLADRQTPIFEQNPGFYEAYDLFHEGTLALADVEMNGIPTDTEYYSKTILDLVEKMKKVKKDLEESEEAILFYEHTGKNLKVEKDISPTHLKIILFDILKHTPTKETDKGNWSIDEEVLKKINIKFTRNVLRLRRWGKVISYPNQFLEASINGVMHPSIALNIPVSFRSSSYDPNQQNIPKRDPEAKKLTRSGIMPYEGFQIVESDFSGVEVGTSCCYHKDPALIKYVTDPNTDMHRDTASDIWILALDEVTKMIRFYSKNCWVFPQFYGSWYKECAKTLWENCMDLEIREGYRVKDHMTRMRIVSFDSFVDHCQKYENKFWNERFPTYNKWKDEINEEYRSMGFIDSHMGFRFQGYMTYNQCTNYQTQGTAFHILLWTIIQVVRTAKEESWKSKLMGQIHDCMIHNTHPSELKRVIETIDHFGTVEVRKVFPWINVPLEIEHEVAPINASWYETKEYKL